MAFKKFFHFLVFSLLLLFFLGGCLESEEKVELLFKPVQCQENAWQQAWLAEHEGEEFPANTEMQVFENYYAQQGFSFESVEITPTFEVTCEACDCPRGDIIKVLVDRELVPALERLGFYQESASALVDSFTEISIKMRTTNLQGLDDSFTVFSDGLMQRVFLPSEKADAEISEGLMERLELESLARRFLEADFLLWEEVVECFDCEGDVNETVLEVGIGSKKKKVTLLEQEYLPSAVKNLLSELEELKLSLEPVTSLAEESQLVSFVDLMVRAEDFNESYVCVKGVYELAEGVNVLRNKNPLEEIDLGKYPERVWIADPNIFEKSLCSELDLNASPWKTCFAVVCGKFSSSPEPAFGVNDQFKFQLSFFSEEDALNTFVKKSQQCSDDIQCIKVQASCCDCSHGGKMFAINARYEKDYSTRFLGKEKCGGIMCLTVISDDPSCASKAKAKCIEEKCVVQ